MDEYKKKLRDWYDTTAHRYDTWGDREGEFSSDSSPAELKSFHKLLKLIKLDKNTKILDVATGTGIYLIDTLKEGGLGYGIDISQQMLNQLKRKVIKSGVSNQIKELKVGDAETIPFNSNFFDIIICIGMFDYYPLNKLKLFLGEMKRVLRPNGKIIVDFPNKNTLAVYTFQKKERSVGHEVHIYELETVLELLSDSGFKVLKHINAGIEIQFLLEVKNEV